MSFNMDDYIDVPARIALFAEKYPLGTLQGTGHFVRDVDEKIVGYLYTAQAYRTPDDPRPGVGTAYEPIPGKTPYTRDSEVMNAETSAWGRAIVACGFETKKIASAEEVRARQDGNGTTTFAPPAQVQENLERNAASSTPPGDGGIPEEVTLTFGKHNGKKLGELVDADVNYLTWLATKFEPKTPDARRVKGAAQTILQYKDEPAAAGVVADEDIPFAASWA
jgi:hypothetical protein